MKCVLPVAATLLLAACVPAPVRPPTQDARDAALARESEAERRAAAERERLAREMAELKRRQAEARQPVAGRISSRPSIAAQALEPTPAPTVEEGRVPAAEPTAAAVLEPVPAPKSEPARVAKATPRSTVEPANIDYASMAWQLSTDLRGLHSHPDVQTFYNDRGWVVSVPAEALFEPGETRIKAGEQETLDSLARVLRHYASRGIVMDGPELERAQAIRRALSARGIPEQAITANGVGERVEFLVPHAGLNAGAGR